MQYETPKEVLELNSADPAEPVLGSEQPDSDPFDSGQAGLGAIAPEAIAADVRPREARPVEGIPAERQPVDFMTPEGRPRDPRP